MLYRGCEIVDYCCGWFGVYSHNQLVGEAQSEQAARDLIDEWVEQ